jgi:elongation factor G
MAKSNVADIRNIALCGHGAAGKTTLADQFLVMTGAVKTHPSVDDRTSICDFDPEEKEHKYSIEASLIHFEHDGKRFNVFDTPGYPDFIGQAICALSGVDLAVIVINAHTGIGVNTRRVFDEAGKLGLGRFIVINKMDTDNIDFPKLLSDIQSMWGTKCQPLNVPIGHGADFHGVVSTLFNITDREDALVEVKAINTPLLESIIENNEEVMERYLEGKPPSDQELSQLIVQAVSQGLFVPIFCCAGKSGIGVKELMDGIAWWGCSPAEHNLVGHASGKENPILPDPNGRLVARVFRTRIDPFVQKLSFIRVYSGTIRKDDHVHASSARKDIKIGQLLQVQADHTSPVDSAGPGDIIALAKMEDLHTGTILGNIELPSVKFPSPMVALAVAPKNRGDETKLSGSLHKVVEEDPTFHVDRDAQTKELIMHGMSELHLTVIRERLKRRDKIEIETKEPKVPLRETILTAAEGSYRHKKQSGGRGQFGEVHIRMMPFPRDQKVEEFATKSKFPSMKEFHYDPAHHFLWVDSVVGGSIPSNFMPAIEKGFKERLENGVIAGYQVQDVCVEVYFGKYHDVDSSEAAFKTAARQVFRQVFEMAKPSLLEPIVKLEITVPDSTVGDIYSDMSGRGGRVHGTESAAGSFQTVLCEVPLREVSTYSRALSSMTGGLGSYTMEFSHYEAMPSNVQQEVVSKSGKGAHEEDE